MQPPPSFLPSGYASKAARQNGSPSISLLLLLPLSFLLELKTNLFLLLPLSSIILISGNSNFLSSNLKSFLAVYSYLLYYSQLGIIFIVADDTCYADDGEKALLATLQSLLPSKRRGNYPRKWSPSLWAEDWFPRATWFIVRGMIAFSFFFLAAE